MIHLSDSEKGFDNVQHPKLERWFSIYKRQLYKHEDQSSDFTTHIKIQVWLYMYYHSCTVDCGNRKIRDASQQPRSMFNKRPISRAYTKSDAPGCLACTSGLYLYPPHTHTCTYNIHKYIIPIHIYTCVQNTQHPEFNIPI